MFWKENGKLIRRLWLNLFGAVVFAFMLSSLSTNIADKFKDYGLLIYIVSGLIGLFFYWYLVYLVVWEAGAKDRIRADGGRIEQRPYFGLKIGLAYSLPIIIPTFIYFVTTFLYGVLGVRGSVVEGILNVFSFMSFIVNMPFVGFAYALFGSLGKNLAESHIFNYGVYNLLISLPTVLFITVGYYFGYQGKFMSRAYKQKKKQ